MRRREFISLVGATTTVWPLIARAQQRTMPVVGILSPTTLDADANRMNAIRQGLKDAGYVEGENVTIEYRSVENQIDRLPELADDLVRHQVAVIVTFGNGVFAAKAATTTIPIVFETASDPVRLGLVAGLARPGGNLTGVTSLNTDVGAKLLELLHELVPGATIIGLLVNPNNPNVAEPTTKSLQGAARALGLEVHVLHASADRDFDTVFATLVQLRSAPTISSLHAASTVSRVRHGWWSGELWNQYSELVSRGRRLHQPHPQRREARRSPGAAGGETRTGHQPPDR